MRFYWLISRQILQNVFAKSTPLLCRARTSTITAKPRKLRNLPLLFQTSFFCGWNFFYPSEIETQKLKYWTFNDKSQVLEEADRLFDNGDYIEVYEILNKIQYCTDSDVLWRVSRALYKISFMNISSSVRKEVIKEAYDMISHALVVNEDSANVNKWMAIIIDLKKSEEGLTEKIKALEQIKYHVMRAVEIEPNDTTLLHMLGKWCYDLASLTWVQRQIANYIFSEPPTATFEEAFEYFLRAEQITPTFYIGNLLMLGKTAIKLKQFNRARYYLNVAAQLPVYTAEERAIQVEAATLAGAFEPYDDVIQDVIR